MYHGEMVAWKVFFFCDEVKTSGTHHYTLRVMAFIVCAAQTPLICHLVDVGPIPFLYLVIDIAYVLHPLLDDFNSLPPTVLDSQSS